MINYATPAELAAYMELEVATTNATILIRHSSLLVADAIQGALYAADANGLPTDATLLAAVKNATCEQAQTYSLTGIDPRAGIAGVTPVVTQKQLDSASVTYGNASGVQAAVETLAAGKTLTDAAYRILDQAGLISNRAITLL